MVSLGIIRIINQCIGRIIKKLIGGSLMQRRVTAMFLWINYFLLGLSFIFYIILLRAPHAFLAGAAVGLIIYGGCYGLIRIGCIRFVRGLLLAVFFSIIAFVLYAAWYVLQKLLL